MLTRAGGRYKMKASKINGFKASALGVKAKVKANVFGSKVSALCIIQERLGWTHIIRIQ